MDEVVVRDVFHLEGAHNLLSQSRLMNWGLPIAHINGFRTKIYNNMKAGCRGPGPLVAMAPQVGGLFRVNVDAAGKGHGSRDVSRDKRYTTPNAIPKEYTYTDSLEPEEPNALEIFVPIGVTSVIN